MLGAVLGRAAVRRGAAVVGGPLDGQLLNVTALTAEEQADGAHLMANNSAYGFGGRADYEPRPSCATRWDRSGYAPS
ncbi:hypothetical protein ACIOHR_37775 [Streptomyces anulatus]